MGIAEHYKDEIERFWKAFVDHTEGYSTIKSVADAVDLRSRCSVALLAYDRVFTHAFNCSKELAQIQMPVKDGTVDYQAYCRARAWNGQQWIEKLQKVIDKVA